MYLCVCVTTSVSSTQPFLAPQLLLIEALDPSAWFGECRLFPQRIQMVRLLRSQQKHVFLVRFLFCEPEILADNLTLFTSSEN